MVIAIKDENDYDKLSTNYSNGHSNNGQHKPTQIIKSVNVSKKEAIEELQTIFGSIRKKFDPKLPNSSIFAILQDNPCLVKCVHEIRHKNDRKPDFDSIYSAKHNWIKNKIIDAILDKFEDQIEVKSEYSLSNGKFDLILQILYDKIKIQYKTRTIAIEIKSGKTVSSKIYCRIERYLVDTDVLLMVRVPYQDVVPIHSERIGNELIEDLSLLKRKANKILSNSIKKVPGDWCRECNADCEFKKSPKWDSSPKGSFEGFEEDLKNVNMVIAKVIILIEETLEKFQKST
jgi:hypothetical protein